MKNSVQWRFLIIAAVVLLVGGSAYAATTTNYQAHGVSAQTFACLSNCSSELYLTLYSNQSGSTTSWTVLFGVFGSDSSGNPTSITGSGPIPASMISGNEQNNLTLNLDTNAAGLQVQSCVADQNYNYTCTPYAGGIITVTWTTTSLYTNHYVQQNHSTLGPLTVHYDVQSDLSSATAQSNAFGTQFSDNFGQLGNSRQGSVSITKP